MREVNIQVVPFKIPASDKFWFLVIFDETTKAIKPGVTPQVLGKTASQRELTELQQQLAASKESLQSASTQFPIVMVDSALTVRRVTPAARNTFNILPSDVGRPIGDFKPNIDIADLEEMLREVIDTLEPRERRVHDRQGVQYSLRVRPYRTTDNKIDGAVITMVDLTEKGPNNKKNKVDNRAVKK